MEQKRFSLPAWIAFLFVIIVYIGFISIGPWRARGYTSDYYSRLAASFRHGQLALQEQPDPALLALPNPYDHRARKDVPVVGDASLYKGKYYLYFGPFPSIPLALLASLVPMEPGDQLFVYLFLIGLFAIQTLVFVEIVKRFFTNLAGWVIPLGILVLGLTGPFTRMLSHPFIHEAAIAGGQFFFWLGFYFAFRSLRDKPLHEGKLFWASFFWACSAATRTTLLFPIAFMVALTWLFIFNELRKGNQERKLLRPTLALLTPLALCGVILAWYNWARFDSIFEFGLYYQLAAFNLQENYDILFSPIYLIQNIYNYFLKPFEVSGVFPFAHSLPGSETPVLPSNELPNLYAVEGKFPGAFLSTPFLLFSVIPILLFVTAFITRFKRGDQKNGWTDLYTWTVFSLLGSFIAGALPTLLLFYAGFRYETDFIPSLTLLSLIGFCHFSLTMKSPSAQKRVAILGLGLAILSVYLNLALSYTGMWG